MRVITALLSALLRCIELVLAMVFGISVILGLAVLGPLAYVPLSLLAVFVHVSIHEAGHAIAGVALGWKLDRVSVGPFELARGPQSFQLRWARLMVDAGSLTLGSTAIVPISFDRFRT